VSTKPIKSALIIRPDGMGDLILFIPSLLALKDELPHARITVLIRKSFLELAKLFDSTIYWITTDLDPYTTGPELEKNEINRLTKYFEETRADIVLAACPRRNWLDHLAVYTLPDAKHIAFNSTERDPYFGLKLNLLLGQNASLDYSHLAPPANADQDWERNYGLIETVLGKSVMHLPPDLKLDPNLVSNVDKILVERGLSSSEYVICAPAGSSHVSIKSWASENYAEVLSWINKKYKSKILIIGHT